MKFSIIAAALGAVSLVAAQDLSSLPPCAQSCAVKAVTSSSGSCGTGDIACYCSNSAFVSAITLCISTECQAQDIGAATAAATALCTNSGIVSSVIASVTGAPSGGVTSAPNGTRNSTGGAPTATGTSSSTGAAATLIPGGFAAAALVAAMFAL